ncbi:MAG: hypothetical protein ACLFOC_04620 [Campylobacterales bacterium]
MSPSYNIKKSELTIHTALNTHPKPKSVALLNDLDDKEFEKYNIELTVHKALKDTLYDVIISDEENVLYAISKLKDDGLAVFCLNLEDDFCDKVDFFKTISPSFRVVMPFFMPYSKEQELFVFASKKYHPTSDLQLQRADMLDNLSFYTPYLHKAIFEQPLFIQNCFKGYLKN